MSANSHVRYSNDGDEYHYLWAARRCLRLLSAESGLVAVSIEGPSEREHGGAGRTDGGELSIDVGEYYGSEDIRDASEIRYYQLKHSTVQPNTPWRPSELSRTIAAFATRYQELLSAHGPDVIPGSLCFYFRSNRPLSPKLVEAVQDIASMATPRHPSTVQRLRSCVPLESCDIPRFFQALRLEGNGRDYTLQRAALSSELRSYLPGNDVHAPVQLKELVTRKALSENLKTPSVRKADVLFALGATEDELFPAPSLIPRVPNPVSRLQQVELVSGIVTSRAHTIIHAAGGVGKSVVAQRLHDHLPEGSVAVVYDCYGSGEYRRVASPRHRHKDALVQIGNELAALGLCDPIVPSAKADPTDYMRAFQHRLREASRFLRTDKEDAILCIVVDAVDCAEIAATEFGDSRSFARDLLLEPLPAGVRLVALCRTERLSLIDPPYPVRKIELQTFAREESAAFLRSAYPDASEGDVDEFHSLTCQNPRVQAGVLAESKSLPSMLQLLGPDPRSVDGTLATLLQNAVADVISTWGPSSRPRVEAMCAALAILRPSIPMAVLATIAGVDVPTVKSFASDLGRPLLVSGDTVQFRDEPVETWFRERFRPDSEHLASFVQLLKPLASSNGYVASTLPHLMLEADQLPELIELALTSSSLPANDPVARRNIERQRLQFALRASIKAKRFIDAAKLALKAAKETAGDTRQQNLIRDNTDLAACLLDSSQVRELVARRVFANDWVGARHAHEATILSFSPETLGEGRSRLRMAHDWLKSWSNLPSEERKAQKIDASVIAEYALAILKLRGPEACAKWLASWRPYSVSYHAGTRLASRLVDHGAYVSLIELAASTTSNIHLLLAINQELREVGRELPRKVVDRSLSLLSDQCPESKEIDLGSVTALVESACLHGLRNKPFLASLLKQYLPEVPPYELASRISQPRFSLLRAYSLRARLDGEELRLPDLAHPRLAERLGEDDFADISEVHREFKRNVEALLPWHIHWANCLLARRFDPTAEPAMPEPPHRPYWQELSADDEIASVWFDSLTLCSDPDHKSIAVFRHWLLNDASRVYIPTWITLARRAAREPALQGIAYEFAQQAFALVDSSRDDAESKASTYVSIARALYGLEADEARTYFHQAIEVVARIGEEILTRWRAILDLALNAADSNEPKPRLAYSLARRAEVAEEYVDDHFDWKRTTVAIADLCPSSCFAVLSRWRDRRIGWTQECLSIAVERLLRRGHLATAEAAALVPFDVQSRLQVVLLRRVSTETDSEGTRSALVNFLLYYIRLTQTDVSSIDLEDMATSAVWHPRKIRKLVSLLDDLRSGVRSEAVSDDMPDSSAPATSEPYWDDLFSARDEHVSSRLAQAYSMFSQHDRFSGRNRFYAELVSRIEAREASELIRAFSELPSITFYDIIPFFESIPPAWRQRMAVQHSLRSAMTKLCRQFAVEIARTRLWQKRLVQTLGDLGGLPRDELLLAVLGSLEQAIESLDPEDLYRVVSLLARLLSSEEAESALQLGLALFDDSLEDTDGDGPWSESLEPPSTVSGAIAGYVAGALGAPQARLRWQAAHVVRALVALSLPNVLDHLAKRIIDADPTPFVDARLLFYRRHAQQWFVIGLARAARDDPTTVDRYRDLLLRLAVDGEPHVVIRHFSVAALRIADAGYDEHITGRLTAMNEAKRPGQGSACSQVATASADSHDRPRRYLIDYYLRKYWLGSLGRCFGVDAQHVTAQVEDLLYDEWGVVTDDAWGVDARARHGLYRGRETAFPHHTYPKTDSLAFYHCYHAMMVVAGELLARHPVVENEDGGYDAFAEWLGRHLLSRHDGYWLADRRDPTPLLRPESGNATDANAWVASVKAVDFKRVLVVGRERLTVRGSWTSVATFGTEHVYVASALVSRDKSFDLLAALQTADEPGTYHLPDAGCEREIELDGFVLRGWIKDPEGSRGLDQFDPWARGALYSPYSPADYVCSHLDLDTDSIGRVWRSHSAGIERELLWSSVWGDGVEDGSPQGDHGRILQASAELLGDLIRSTECHLIVGVEIRRRPRTNFHLRERGTADDARYPPVNARFYIVTGDGEWHSL